MSRTNHGIFRRNEKICVIVATLYPACRIVSPDRLCQFNQLTFYNFYNKTCFWNLPAHCVLRNKQRCLLSRITVDSLNLSRFFFFQLLSSGSFKHSSACPTVNTGTKRSIWHFDEWSTMESWNYIWSTFSKIFSEIRRTRRTIGPL